MTECKPAPRVYVCISPATKLTKNLQAERKDFALSFIILQAVKLGNFTSTSLDCETCSSIMYFFVVEY